MLSNWMEFPTAQEAKAYRKQTGCGGWIFEDMEDGDAVLLPPRNSHGEVLTPRMIFTLPVLRGRSGKLYH